jgi:hypothetical protein
MRCGSSRSAAPGLAMASHMSWLLLARLAPGFDYLLGSLARWLILGYKLSGELLVNPFSSLAPMYAYSAYCCMYYT